MRSKLKSTVRNAEKESRRYHKHQVFHNDNYFLIVRYVPDLNLFVVEPSGLLLPFRAQKRQVGQCVENGRIYVPIPHNRDEAKIAGILAGAVDVGGGLVRFHHLPNLARRH